MSRIDIGNDAIPRLDGKVAIITGGSSGIGLAAGLILASYGADVHLLDLSPPEELTSPYASNLHFHRCDVLSWASVRDIFDSMVMVHMVFANAGVSENVNTFTDTYDAEGRLEEPQYAVLGVNFRSVCNVTKLGWSKMRKTNVQGSIVITASATAFAPEQSLPVYSATKLGLVGLVRSLRSTIIRDNITINAVAPAATITKLLPADLAAPILAAGLPVSSAHFVGMALVYSAVATQDRMVETYGKDDEAALQTKGRRNGRVILTLGATYTELEEGIADTRRQWFGEYNTRFTKMQQSATDVR